VCDARTGTSSLEIKEAEKFPQEQQPKKDLDEASSLLSTTQDEGEYCGIYLYISIIKWTCVNCLLNQKVV